MDKRVKICIECLQAEKDCKCLRMDSLKKVRNNVKDMKKFLVVKEHPGTRYEGLSSDLFRKINESIIQPYEQALKDKRHKIVEKIEREIEAVSRSIHKLEHLNYISGLKRASKIIKGDN